MDDNLSWETKNPPGFIPLKVPNFKRGFDVLMVLVDLSIKKITSNSVRLSQDRVGLLLIWTP